jgi:hypothetical protein
MLPDRSIAVVHELISVILESPAKVIQYRPSDMTRGTTQSVFTGERWDRVRMVCGSNNQKEQQKSARQVSPGRDHAQSSW